MDVDDRFWQWAEKPPESPLTIPAALHHAAMSLSQENRKDLAKVNAAAAGAADPDR